MENKETYTPQEVAEIVSTYLATLNKVRDYVKLKLLSVDSASKEIFNSQQIPQNVRVALDKNRVAKDLASLV